MAFDLEEFRRWDRQVDHGNDELVEAAIDEIERLRATLDATAEKLDSVMRSAGYNEATINTALADYRSVKAES